MKEYCCLSIVFLFLNLCGADSPGEIEYMQPLGYNSDSSISSSYHSSSSEPTSDVEDPIKYSLVPDELFELSFDFENEDKNSRMDTEYKKMKKKLRNDPVAWLGYKVFKKRKRFVKSPVGDKPSDDNYSLTDISKRLVKYHDFIELQQEQIRTLYSLVRKSFQATKHLEASVMQLQNELAKKERDAITRANH